MVRPRGLFLLIFHLLSAIAAAQIGGNRTYSFLNLTPSPVAAALGGVNLTTNSNNPAEAFYNPALPDSNAHHTLAIQYMSHFAGINLGYAAYSYTIDGFGTLSAGIHYINYGKLQAADEIGNLTGSFSAAEYAIIFSYGRAFDIHGNTIHAAASIKPIISTMETYTSFGILCDIGARFSHRSRLFEAGLTLKNFGFQIKPYSDGHREKLPLLIELGLAQKLAHAPVQFFLNIQHLETFALSPIRDSGFKTFGDELLRHIVPGIDISPFNFLHIRAAFNYHRRQELKISTKPGLAGFSWGLGLELPKFSIDFARARWHLAGATHHLSLALNLKNF